jgi:hypothetical protein
VREIAALWHLPYDAFSAPRILWASKLVTIPEPVARNTEGAMMGEGKYQGRLISLHIPPIDRATHINIVGKTGTGKSTLLHHLVHQDIAEGRGVAVIDPHGKLVRDILHGSIPDERINDVVILDLANPNSPPPLNPLGSIRGYAGTLRVVSIIERLFARTEQGARMSSYLRAALLPLHTQPHATMRDVTRIFMDEVYREQLLEQIADAETQDFWDFHYATSSPQMQRQIAEPIINRIRPFFANPHLYPVLCHPDTLDFRPLIQHNKMYVVKRNETDEAFW